MAYQCPRCGQAVRRGYSVGAQAAAGLVGAFLVMAFGSFQCPSCGKLSRGEFSSEDRTKMMLGSAGLVCCAVGLLAGVIWLLAAMNH